MLVIGILPHQSLHMSSVQKNQDHDGTKNGDTSNILVCARRLQPASSRMAWRISNIKKKRTYPAPSTTGNTVVVKLLVGFSPPDDDAEPDASGARATRAGVCVS